jgi:indole-3-glycerol phosphate synthase
MSDKLTEICATKAVEVAARKPLASLANLDARASEQTAPRGFEAALRRHAATGFALIAEIKKASPSKGLIALISIRPPMPAPIRPGAPHVCRS